MAIRPNSTLSLGRRGLIAAAGIAFFLVRIGGGTASFWLYDRSYDRELAALQHIPAGARVASFVGRRCENPWTSNRLEHLPGLLVVRREAFSNDQWAMAGAQLLTVKKQGAEGFREDPSQIVVPEGCAGTMWRTTNQALRDFPRNAFDYVWLISPPAYDEERVAKLHPIWRSGQSVLYRVPHANEVQEAAQPSLESRKQI